MGRYLAAGVPVEIRVFKKNNFYGKDYDIIKNKEKIIKELSRFLDMSKYECVSEDDNLLFKFKLEEFNKHIYDFFKETYELLPCDCIFYTDKEITYITKDDYLIKLKEKEKDSFSHYYIEVDGEESSESDYSCFETPEYWLLEDNKELRVQMEYILLWYDIYKYDSEDDINLLRILNTVSRGYFKNELWKNILFYITG